MRWAERSFNCFDNLPFRHLSSSSQVDTRRTFPKNCESKRIPVKTKLTCDFDGRHWNSAHQTSRTLSVSSVHLRLSSTLPLSPSYIIRFAALLSLPAAFVFPSSSSSSSYFIPWLITPLTLELNTYSKSTPTSHHFFCPLRHPLKRSLITTLIRPNKVQQLRVIWPDYWWH